MRLSKNWRISVQFDPRIVKVSIEVNGQTKTYENLAITARGTKYANALQNECDITITNLDKQTQDYILTYTSPFTINASPKKVTLYAGRQSYGTFVVFSGNVVSSSLSQPPDTTITLRCLTGNFQKGNILAKGQPSNVLLSVVARQIAAETNTILSFQAADRNLFNFSFSGAAQKQINNLNFVGGVNVFIDNDVLIVKNQGQPINNTVVIVNQETGMVGIPELTEQGSKVKYLLDNKTKLGGSIRVTSQINPAINGDYVIYKLGFQIANRDEPFYWIAESARRRQ